MVLRISNTDARRIWLSLQDMATPPTGALTQDSLAGIVQRLGMVQLDPLRVVARAHDHILWSRNANYRPRMLERLLAKDRLVFEHFTHDAAVLPMQIYPMWQRQRARKAAQMERGSWGTPLPPPEDRQRIKDRIAQEGPLCSRDFEASPRGGEVWTRSAHRVSLDYLWHAGDLATAERRNFTKVFDLAERVIPEAARCDLADDAAQLHWLCTEAIARLGFGTVNEIKGFYDAADLSEIKAQTADASWWQPVEIESVDGEWMPMLARPDIEDVLASAAPPCSRLRIVNPFDPIARDRARALRLFGFDYRIEIYTPAEKRKYGYYVYPMLEGDRFVGRIEIKADRDASILRVLNLWPETGVRFGSGRMARLEKELDRMARFVGVEKVEDTLPHT